MFHAALTCHRANEQLWHSQLLWRAVLHALGAPEAALRDAGFEERGANRQPPPAKALRDFARRWLLGIDMLVAIPKEISVSRTMSLALANRAVLAMQPEDGDTLIQRAAESLANLLRSRAPGESELVNAESLLEAVSTRTDLFTIAQMLDMLGAHQEQALSLPVVQCPRPHEHSQTSHRRSRFAGCSARVHHLPASRTLS